MSIKMKLIRKLKLFTFLFFILSIIFGSIHLINASNLNNQQKDEIAKAIANSDCPEPIKNLYLDKDNNLKPGVDVSLEGTVVYGYKLDAQGNRTNPIPINCVSASQLEKLFVRIFMAIIVLAGIILIVAEIIGIVKFLIASAGEQPSAKEETIKGLYMPFVFFIALLFAYPLFVTFFVDILGIGVPNTNTKPEYTFFCKNTILFNLTFDRNDPCK